ncbi:glycoside hydrolase family 9 protein [Flexithrix dorotheae]|uniref:glycoside hydrolase family 9 protein n=1 Tax=Flexithrix dorotheae TaxID=70993 RepID=UPI00037AF44C|nr:glycoside hydrolase family 9 protein [Flexithrix dorotheae]
MKKAALSILLAMCLLKGMAQDLTTHIVIDQFGYRPSSEKIAVIRDPQTGFDEGESFIPGDSYALVNATNDQHVFTGAPMLWNNGAEDTSSGDKAWWFDFSTYSSPGTYYILDISNNVRSFEFEIREDIYNEILIQAVRTFFYQRVGQAKEAPCAEDGWTDGASHMGPLQDTESRVYDDPNNAATERDVRGGWYDAGDYNKYTNWTANYVHTMLLAYEENPEVWGDNYNIPESGNGIADILDEAKWGMDHLLRMQKSDGSMISIVGESGASPPSATTGPSLYGGVNTSSTWNGAGTFAYGAKIYASLGMDGYADTLKKAALNAWTWAVANPNVIWKNNDAAYGSVGIGAGQQETDDYGREMGRLKAAAHLFEITGESTYKTHFENNYKKTHMMEWNFVFPFETKEQETLLYYTQLEGASPSVVNDIITTYNNSINNNDINFPAHDEAVDPYGAFIDTYTWGSNNTKAQKGLNFYVVKHYGLNASRAIDAEKAAERYIHYLHGVNPLNKLYLTNMYAYGGDNCADQIYHTWFHDGTDWDETGVSKYGPAPGFVPGGPNPSYDWDNCCPNGCGGASSNEKCLSIEITPPKGQPAQKSYLDFNETWPINSWSVTENSCGYQVSYIRLLSKFATKNDKSVPVEKIVSGLPEDFISDLKLILYPNPATNSVKIKLPEGFNGQKLSIYALDGKKLFETEIKGINSIDIPLFERGVYLVNVEGLNGGLSQKLVIE